MTRRRPMAVPSSSWLTTYSDLVTLLLCFFVLLYSFSAIDVVKFRRFVASFQGVGILDGGTIPDSTSPIPIDQVGDTTTDTQGPFWSDTGRLTVYVQEFLSSHGIEGEVQVYRAEQGVLLELRDHLLFDSGRADIRLDGVALLNKLGELFSQLPNEVTVEGHTDNIPIRTAEYPTNWELSGARAARVVRYFVEIRGLDPKRFAFTGYGEFRPVEPNTTANSRARNRRVVFVIRPI